MDPSQATETFVIFYAKPSNCWAAFGLNTRQLGLGANPQQALANSAKSSARHTNAHGRDVSYELMQILGKTAQPLPAGDCTPGVVYTHVGVLPQSA